VTGPLGAILFPVLLAALTASGPAVPLRPLPQLPLEQFPAGLRDRVAEALRRAEQQPDSAAAAGELAMLLHAYDQTAAAAAAYERARALDPASFEWT
jgi:hypothetical protein